MINRMRTSLLVVLCALATADLQAQDRGLAKPDTATGRRIAFVIGNDKYTMAPLKNGVADARAIAGTLRTLGFEVTALEDANRLEMVRGLARVADRLRADDVALFFFAGHGVQVAGENYLIPVDYADESATAVRLSSLAVSDVRDAMGKARVAVIVLDACRNNPYGGQRGGTGLAPVEAHGTLIAFATGAGQTASDNASGVNGLFTQELLRELRQPNVTARGLFYGVRRRVHDATNGRQFPAVYDGLVGDVALTFAAPVGAPPAPAPAMPPSVTVPDSSLVARQELALWEAIKDSRDPSLFEDYLRRYGQGIFARVAQERLNALRSTSSAPPATSTPSAPASSVGRPSAVSSAAPGLPDARAILARYVEVSGGVNLLKHSSVRMTGTITSPAAALSASMEFLSARPNKLLVRTTFTGLGVYTEGFDGNVAWAIDPTKGAMIASDKEREQKRFDADFYGDLTIESRYTAMRTLERTMFHGRPCYKLAFTAPDKSEDIDYFDVETGLRVGREIRREMMGVGSASMTTTFLNYKKFSNMLVPTTVRQTTAGIETVITVLAVEFDTVPPGTFDLPPAVRALVR